MIEQCRNELFELARAIRGLDSQHTTELILHRIDKMERRLLAAIKDPSTINLEPLTAELKTANDALDATVKANQPPK